MASQESSAKPATPEVKAEPIETTESKSDTAVQPDASKPAADQLDGSGTVGNGGPLADTELKVEVKLADLQADPDNPLYSAKTFEELKL